MFFLLRVLHEALDAGLLARRNTWDDLRATTLTHAKTPWCQDAHLGFRASRVLVKVTEARNRQGILPGCARVQDI